MKTIGWGMIGTGAVSRKFAGALASFGDARRVAVASRNAEGANRFAQEFGFARSHHDLDALLAEPDIDVVHLASPTRLHAAHAMRVLDAGKALLCEKPFTGSFAEAQGVAAAARAAGLFCMEAMWLRFNAVHERLAAQIREGRLGEVASLSVSLGYGRPPDTLGMPEDRRGATHVFGCYGLSLALSLFGPPATHRAVLTRTPDGVDTDAAILLGYPGGPTVLIDASVSATRANRLDVAGRNAAAVIPGDVVNPATLVVRSAAGGRRDLPADVLDLVRSRLLPHARMRSSGMRGEIAEVMRCLREGLLESPRMPPGDTLAAHRLMDAIVGDAA